MGVRLKITKIQLKQVHLRRVRFWHFCQNAMSNYHPYALKIGHHTTRERAAEKSLC
jgi:hypothetical protein